MPETSGMASRRRTEWFRMGSPPSSRNCLDSPSGKPMRRLSPAAATMTQSSPACWSSMTRSSSLGRVCAYGSTRLKIILPDGLCSTLVTSALTRDPTSRAPDSTTIMVPSSR